MAGENYLEFSEMVTESACAMLNYRGVLSDPFVSRVLERRHKGTINIQDAKELIEDFLMVLCESTQRPETKYDP